jgi:hypothetical protein
MQKPTLRTKTKKPPHIQKEAEPREASDLLQTANSKDKKKRGEGALIQPLRTQVPLYPPSDHQRQRQGTDAPQGIKSTAVRNQNRRVSGSSSSTSFSPPRWSFCEHQEESSNIIIFPVWTPSLKIWSLLYSWCSKWKTLTLVSDNPPCCCVDKFKNLQ